MGACETDEAEPEAPDEAEWLAEPVTEPEAEAEPETVAEPLGSDEVALAAAVPEGLTDELLWLTMAAWSGVKVPLVPRMLR